MIYKIFIIIIITVPLLAIDTIGYLLLRRISKDRNYSGQYLDDAYIAGIAAIVVFAIMLWKNI